MKRVLKVAGITVAAVGVTAAIATLFVRDSIARHQRDLFSQRPLRRLAALGFLAGQPASVHSVYLLRDFISSEPRKLIRGRGRAILDRMELELESGQELPEESLA
jgi:hypothetical protein